MLMAEGAAEAIKGIYNHTDCLFSNCVVDSCWCLWYEKAVLTSFDGAA